MAPALANMFFPGSATANYYDLIWGQYGGSDADAVHAIDRVKSRGVPELHHQDRLLHDVSDAEQRHVDVDQRRLLRLQRRDALAAQGVQQGLSFDVNYTLAHSHGQRRRARNPAAASAGGIMLNPYDLDSFYGDSDFDVRHNLNGNVLFELPFGRASRSSATPARSTDALVGGWQVSGIFRYRSGLPTAVAYSRHLADELLVQHARLSGRRLRRRGDRSTRTANPAIFPIHDGGGELAADAAGRSRHARGGAPGRLLQHRPRCHQVLRACRRGHRLQFRAEAFNAFNNVNFTNVSLDASSPNTFGQFTNDRAARG